ncbi:MAG: chemotaxis protein CheW [Sterolibacterium sp.]|nr:chemotaxis protein CheW [Sterolibacterium sp.]
MARRLSLREFQAGLAERLTSAARGENSRALLGIQAGDAHWLLGLADAGEIVPLASLPGQNPLTPVALTKPWFAGLVNIRGVLHGVVDFSLFQGGAPTPLNDEARLLLIGTRHGSNCALLVSRTLGLKNPDDLECIAPADETAAAQPWVGDALRDQKEAAGPQWRHLRVSVLLTHPQFLDVAWDAVSRAPAGGAC